MKMRLVALLVVLVALAALGVWWYRSVYTATPEYALQMVQEAVAEHDKAQLYEYADVEHLVSAAGDAALDGLVQAMVPATGDTKDAVSSLTKMFREPVVLSLQTAVDNYVQYGTWGNRDTGSTAGSPVDSNMILTHLGLPTVEVQGLESVAVDGENATAVAKVRVLQTETGEEFVLDVELVEQADHHWMVYEITNFKEFIESLHVLRQKQLKTYLEDSASLMQQHDAVISGAEQEISALIAEGTLGSDEVRSSIKALVESTVIPDWQARKADLEAMTVPEAAGSLHRLRLKICNARIDSAEKYAQWMDDKQAATIRASDNSLRTAKTLEKEAEVLTRQNGAV